MGVTDITHVEGGNKGALLLRLCFMLSRTKDPALVNCPFIRQAGCSEREKNFL